MPKRVADSSDDDSDDGEDVPLAARMSGGARRSASKKASYAEKENSDSDDDDEDGSPGGGDDDSNVAPTDEDEGGGDSSDAEEEEEDDDDEYKGSDSDEPPPPKKAKAAAASSSKKSPASKAAAPKSAAVKKAAAPLPKQPKLSAAAEASSRLEQAESSRRLDAAVESGVLQRDRAAAYEYPVLHPAKDLRAQTLDISAKPKTASRATKYLIALPGHLAPIDGGAGVGQIEKLDTANPELLLDFHGKGKLRLRGTVVYPRSPFLTLQRKGSTLLSDDAFDNVIAFSAAEWLDGDGSGAPAALPESLNKPMHKSWSYEGGCAADNPTASKGNRRGGGGGKATKASPSKATKALAPSLDEEGGGGAGDGDSNDGDGDGDGDGGAPSAARSRSFRERKVQKYEDKGSDVEDGSDDDDVEITGELRRVSAYRVSVARAGWWLWRTRRLDGCIV